MGIFSDILLTVDFDRTLTATDSSIPQRNLEAIQYFMENGGAFTVNTGRSRPMTKIFRDIVPVNAPLLVCNGSAAYDVHKDELLLCKPIALDPREVVEHLQQRFPELTVEFQAVDAHYFFRKDEEWERFCEYNSCDWRYSAPEAVPGPFLKFALYGKVRERTVASMYEASPQEIALCDEAQAYVEQHYGHAVDVFRPCARIIDCHAKGVSKIRAARDLQKQLGRKILICVGDAYNDLPMLEGADYAFCPSDGLVADRFENVCPCGEGAVADVIYEKIPSILQKRT
jgi:HAD superfamily hydrolase (TIGR01484 family)